MHISFILQQYVCYITILNTFRAVPCSSSGGTNCIITASGIVTLCKQPYSMQFEGGLQSALKLHTVRVEDRNVTYILLKNKRIVH